MREGGIMYKKKKWKETERLRDERGETGKIDGQRGDTERRTGERGKNK